jgi:integrase
VQDAREVRTKFSKTFTTWFFPVGQDVRQIVVDWLEYLTTEKLFGPVDPLFPATEVVQDQYHLFQTGGLSRAHWSNATPIRAIFKEAFTNAGLAYANPHSFRKTLAQLGERLCRTPEEFKAWSQNLGHEQVLTTFSSYGQVAADRQAELIRRLGQRHEADTPKAAMIERLIQVLNEEGRYPPE